MSNEKIMVYTKRGCSHCEDMKVFINGSKHIGEDSELFEFHVRESNIGVYRKALAEGIRQNGEITTLPMVFYRGDLITTGFNPFDIMNLIDKVKENN